MMKTLLVLLALFVRVDCSQEFRGTRRSFLPHFDRSADEATEQPEEASSGWQRDRRPDLSAWRRDRDYSLSAIPASAIYGVVAGAALSIIRAVTAEPFRRAVQFWTACGPIVFHYKFTEWWLGVSRADQSERDRAFGVLHQRYAEPSYAIILNLKGLYVKIAQVLSSRPDFLPEIYVNLFSNAQDAIPQWPIEKVRGIMDQSLHQELGLSFEDVFVSMDPIALGSASIGQVHRAVLVDHWDSFGNYTGGSDVAVKVMHRGCKKRFRYDFQVLRWLSRLALPGWRYILDEVERRVLTEFDYRNEAFSLATVRTNLEQSPYASRVVVPQPHSDLCTEAVLVMEMLHGPKLVDGIKEKLGLALGGDKETAAAFIAARQRELVSGEEQGSSDLLASIPYLSKLKLLLLRRQMRGYVDLLIDVHGQQIFCDGVFNGDCHPGNTLLLNNGMLGLIDYGQTRVLSRDDRLAYSRVIAEIARDDETGEYDDRVAQAVREAGFTAKNNSDASSLSQYAQIFFDSDVRGSILGFSSPQHYFASLNEANPLVTIPETAIFIARTSFLFRGLGGAFGGGPIRTSKRWAKHAEQAMAQESSH
jgi:aarF domain-containing kinase